MITETLAVQSIAPYTHDEAMRLATAEYDRLLAVVDGLDHDDWSRPTDCVGWDVRAMLGHILGALELQADPAERDRQLSTAAADAARNGGTRLDAMTALQVHEHAALTTDELRRGLHHMAPRALAARSATTPAIRDIAYDPQIPGESGWTLGYLYDVVLTRDPWIHRVDICRAIGEQPVLSADHDGRIVADVVADWARRHGHPFTLALTGPAGGTYSEGSADDELQLDAVEFCRVVSGRARATGLLATPVIF